MTKGVALLVNANMGGKIKLYQIRILESHLDTFGHVNNAAYLKIFEEARWDYVTENGYGLEEVLSSNLGPIILGVTVKFRRELRLREMITVETQCISYRKKIGTIAQHIFNSEGELAAQAEFTLGLFNTLERRLVPPTPKWLKAVGMPVKRPPEWGDEDPLNFPSAEIYSEQVTKV